jgi:hypothetical protein
LSGIEAVDVRIPVPAAFCATTFPAVLMLMLPQTLAVSAAKTRCWAAGLAVKYRYSRNQAVGTDVPVSDVVHEQLEPPAVPPVATLTPRPPCAA